MNLVSVRSESKPTLWSRVSTLSTSGFFVFSDNLDKVSETHPFSDRKGSAQIVLHISAVRKVNPKFRRYTMRQIIFATLMMLIILGTTVACNTIHGLGHDIERAGEKTQDAADAVKKKL
jgi:predicted small secreted protein